MGMEHRRGLLHLSTIFLVALSIFFFAIMLRTKLLILEIRLLKLLSPTWPDSLFRSFLVRRQPFSLKITVRRIFGNSDSRSSAESLLSKKQNDYWGLRR